MTERSSVEGVAMPSPNRRRFLGTLATVVGIGSIAGCLGSDGNTATDTDSGGGGSTPTEAGNMDSTTTQTTSENFGNNSAGRGLAAQPRLGPEPTEATGVVIAFEDPSCPRCRAFHREVLPQLKSDLIDPGDVSYVFRSYPVVYPWGKPGVQALESTYARSESAHWQLLDEYFASQSGYDTENVFDRTQMFLETNTDVDATAVVEDARNKAHDSAVQADLSAGKAAGAGQTTPSLFLFRDGEFVTKAAGSISFSVIKNALGL